MASQISGGSEVAVHVYQALYGQAPSYALLNSYTAQATADSSAWANQMTAGFASLSDSQFATLIMGNIGLGATAIPTVYTELQAALTGYLTAVGAANRGIVTMQLAEILSNLENATGAQSVYSAAAKTFNDQSFVNFTYGSDSTHTSPAVVPVTPFVPGVTFGLTSTTIAGAEAGSALDIMNLFGDQYVRIDLTANNNQVKGLDLNGNRTIDNNGKEIQTTTVNVTTLDDGKDFEIVNAYSTNRTDENDLAHNFLGNIAYDGTGFGGDGVSTDGNIVLGGLGADTILGGIGNDFLAGGGVATGNSGMDRLDGGRNADFFFAELSLLDNTDGNNLVINGGSTSDDAAVGNNTPQDADWLLIEVSDDEDGTVINLADGADDDSLDENDQSIVTGAGRTIQMTEIENVDASGNLYGFLNGVNVALGGAGKVVANGEGANQNVGIGSSAQLHIIGSIANNILIGGFDNDRIEGGAGSDLLFGGNLNYNNNTNLAGIVNNGMDEMIGGSGEDNIVFEADGGIIEGGFEIGVNDVEADTLWLTRESLGSKTAATMLTDGVLRLDLGVGKEGGVDNYAGYGGADAGGNGSGPGATFTADQSKYISGASRVQVQDMESVIATGLGGVDYVAAGTNNPDLKFNNQQNHFGYQGDLTLRGTTGANTLYANTGNDIIEGRNGNDLLSGGAGNDDFVFQMKGDGDGIDVIHRQQDANNDNLWDTDADGEVLYTQDFGVNSSSAFGPSTLSVDFTAANLADVNVWMSSFAVKIGAVNFAVSDLVALKEATTVAGLAALANAAFQAIDSHVTVTASGNILTITDATATGGRVISSTAAAGYAVTTSVTAPGTSTLGLPTFVAAGEQVSQDRLIFAAYDDRADGEYVDDDANFGGDTLGSNAYAQDLVVGFNRDGSTVLAEAQKFAITFTNLAVQDKATVTVNGVVFSLQVGKALDGSLIGGESNNAFVARLATYINDYLDDDTAAGKVVAVAGGDTLTLTQANYSGEETVFMQVGVDVKDNSSNGEPAKAVVANQSATDITLYDFVATNGKLNAENVLFVGDAGVGPDGRVYSELSRSVLATAKDAGGALLGSDAIVVNVTGDDAITSAATDEGVGTDEIFFNAAKNPTTGRADNFAIHGDDQLFGGKGADTIDAGTGDDRVYGSLGADRIDGGKDLYLVDGVIRVLNAAEALVVDALPATISIEKIVDGEFDDTLIYQQSDFGTVGAGGASFNIALDLSAAQANGGAGRVIVNGAAANTTLFTNMEHIRTVSGNGTLVGQGNDTLDLSVSVNPVTGATAVNGGNMRYFLTKEADFGGEVRVATTVAGNATGVGTVFTKVDGVENVMGGTGTDYLYIDQTESGKNNSFDAGTSTVGDDAAETAANGDKIFYQNNGVALTPAQLPMVKVAIGAANVDTVTMSGGQLMAGDMPVDTLTGVEFIDIGAVAQNVLEADVIDVSGLAAGAVVNYTNGQISNGAALVSTVVGINQLEVVAGSTADDTVVVAPIAMMGGNSSSDAADLVQDNVGNIRIDSYLTYDVTDELIGAALDADTTADRMNIADLRAVTGPSQVAAQAALVDAINQNQFKFNLVGGTDTVDYSKTADAIAAVVDFTSNAASQYVLVGVGNNNLVDAGDRIDQLTSVERIVASQASSVLDLTGSNQDLKITFSNNFNDTNVASWDANFSAGKYGREVHEIKVANALSGTSVLTTSYIDYTFVDTSAADLTALPANARWTGIEGSDKNETVELSGYEAGAVNTINLRGGANQVTYEGTKIEAVISIEDYDAATPSTTGIISASITHTAVADDHNALTVADPTIAATDTVKSYSQQNGISKGALTIKATRGAQDSFAFDALTTTASKLYVFGGAVDATPSINVQVGAGASANSLQLIGFELVQDSGVSNDVYDIVNLASISPDLRLTDDGVTPDHDTIKVGNGAALLDGGGATDINLAGLRLAANNTLLSANFNTFDVLDVTNVTGATITTVVGTADTTDELVVGALPGIVNATAFESVVVTNAFVTAYGTSITLDTTANTLTAGTKTVTADAALRTVSLGGTALDGSFDLDSNLTATANVSVTAIGAGAVTFIGGSGNNTLTGAGGDDTLRGGMGNDILDGGFVAAIAPIVSYDFNGGAATLAADGNKVAILGVTVEADNNASVVVSATNIAVTVGADADAVGGSFAAVPLATWKTQLAADATFQAANGGTLPLATAAAANLQSVTYDAVLNKLLFTFNGLAQTIDQTDFSPAVVTGGTVTATRANAQVAAPRAESSDTFVFEETAALNGVDIINNFNMTAALTDDVLDFTAFLGAAASYDGDADENAAAEIMTLSGGENVGVFYNSAALTASRVKLVGTANGQVVIDNDGKAVVLVSADVDGAGGGADVTNQSYSVYFIEDTTVGAGFTPVVTLVGTVNSAAELNAFDWTGSNFA